MSKVVIYARYSSNKQREESIEGQIRICREYAEKHDMEVINEYIDRAETGLSFDKRDSALRMIKDSAAKGFTAVLVYKYDRFSRDQADFYNYKKILNKNGVRLISAMEDIGEGAQSTLIMGVHTAVNNYYSQELAEKATRGMQENALAKKSNGSYPKYGYDIVDGSYKVNEKEAPVVKSIFDDYINGVSIKEIMGKLNGMGLKTKVGKEFTNDYLNRLLKCPLYYGLYRWDTIQHDMPELAIIDKATYDKAQKRMAHNQQTGSRARSSVQYALIDKAFCGHCGQPLVADCVKKKRKNKNSRKEETSGRMDFSVSSTKAIVEAVEKSRDFDQGDDPDCIYYRYYVCRGTKNKAHLNGCKKKRISRELLERQVVGFTADQYLTDVNINRIAKATTKLQAGRPSQKEIKEYEEQIKTEQNKIDNLMDMIEQGMGTKTAYERVAQAEQRIEVAQHTIEEIKARNAPDMSFEQFRDKLIAIREKMQSFFKNGNIPDNVLKEFCDIFITSVYVYDEDDDLTRVHIIFDELEVSGLDGFNEADIKFGLSSSISGSPIPHLPNQVIYRNGTYFVAVWLKF